MHVGVLLEGALLEVGGRRLAGDEGSPERHPLLRGHPTCEQSRNKGVTPGRFACHHEEHHLFRQYCIKDDPKRRTRMSYTGRK